MNKALLPLISRRDERGATATEYGMLIALVALVALVGINLLGDALGLFYDGLVGDVENNW